MEHTINIQDQLKQLYKTWALIDPSTIESLPLSGSDRLYFRLTSANQVALGVYNPDKKENRAFINFTKHFLATGISVPKIYAIDEEKCIYIIEDLGDTTLYSFLISKRILGEFSAEAIALYKKILQELPKIQVVAGKNLDYSVCYPRAEFDKQSMQWDLSYFKYYFLKLAKIPFDEQALEDDFQVFINYLLEADRNHFLYRDFQSRNIMIKGGKPFFIDYQGGRKGALQYDLASLLYDAKADIPQHVRNELVDYYITQLEQYIPINRDVFLQQFYGYVLIRIMQAMGAYGFRGFYEKKEHFLQSIPFALENLKYLLSIISLPIQTPVLFDVLHRMTESNELKKIGQKDKDLTIAITSFSYKKGLPEDFSGNGGGFIFDCRALPNPGRYDEYKQLTGMDQPVIDFLEKEEEVLKFLHNVYAIIDQSIERYLQRNFTSLMINFGCTGGQHRSVYSAERMREHILKKYNVHVFLKHREQEK